ncbi:sensor histidine kinase [Leptospira alexanderi]|uniref:histidine kinase n=1 Tax=Leptospira alexanderi serovar Manhao 3 str. L 60 TaxID=1049759 RepID=V6I2J0_9LEPT|nr:sensor histidine kinase [Leptospira alexanderi]EQA64445.1 CHASE3 domain protein [Leptospira alexanderi serovar Manhao 3 str. L 60]
MLPLKNTIEKNIAYGLTGIVVLNFIMIGSAYYTLKQSLELKRWEVHTREVLLNIEETFSAFNEAHAVLRAYILYLDQEQLNAYFKSKSLVLERIGKLRKSMIDNPYQQQRLSLIETYLSEKFFYMDKLVLMRKHASMQHYLVLFRSAQGKDLSEKIKSLIQDIKAEEFRLLDIRKNNSKMHLTISVTLLFSGITLNLFFIFLQNWSIYKESQRRQKAESVLEVSNKNLKTYSERLERSNKDLEAFSYSVSHDLRSPIRGILGFSKILLEDYGTELGEESRRIVNIIIQSSENMGELIDDLLEYSRLGRKEPIFSIVNMQIMVEKILEEIMNYYPDIKMETIVGDLPPTKGDPSLLKQLLFNLISNSFKYSKKKENPKIEIGSYQNNGETVFFVKDNGAGFDMKYQHKLFNIFQRLHHADQFEGTGVGLAIVKRVIERHNGKVWGNSKLNEGACFYFTLGVDDNHV